MDGSEAYLSSAQVYFRVNGKLGSYETRYYARHKLLAGSTIAGPAILFQKDTTTLIPPNWSAQAKPSGNLILAAQS